jgi:hypothetical protein
MGNSINHKIGERINGIPPNSAIQSKELIKYVVIFS